MSNLKRLSISVSDQTMLNKRKNEVNITKWKDKKRKLLRDSGKEYVSRNGKTVPGKTPPVKVSNTFLSLKIYF